MYQTAVFGHFTVSSVRSSIKDMSELDMGSVFTARRKASFASAVYATAYPSVRLSVRLSVCHTPVLCQSEGTQQRDAVFTFW